VTDKGTVKRFAILVVLETKEWNCMIYLAKTQERRGPNIGLWETSKVFYY